MRDRVADLSRQLDSGNQGGAASEALEDECRRLRSDL